ncbi:hypothetical protein ACIBHY_53955 [Nonomuraea sp. NPDC050547]|uniref:hypothetical protein n=1 Tax=Nonomuraea sp. NPDC050547 TaxID=3364368 RepID=UPI00378A0A16
MILDPSDWRVVPVDHDHPSGAWAIVDGEAADVGEPDLCIEVRADAQSQQVAESILSAVCLAAGARSAHQQRAAALLAKAGASRQQRDLDLARVLTAEARAHIELAKLDQARLTEECNG